MQPKLSPPDLMYLSGLTSGSLLQISLLQNVPCVLNRSRCDFLQSCREQSKALGFPVHTMPLHHATHVHMKSKWRGTDPSKDLFPTCEASLQRYHTTYVSPENCVPTHAVAFSGCTWTHAAALPHEGTGAVLQEADQGTAARPPRMPTATARAQSLLSPRLSPSTSTFIAHVTTSSQAPVQTPPS